MQRSRFFPTLLTLPLLLLMATCEAGAPWDGEEEAVTEERPDFGPAAAYDRRLVFLGPGEALPTAAVFDFGSISDSLAMRRGIRARLVDGSEWIPLLDAGWESEPMREPWRILPHGPLRMIMRDGGEMASLVLRGDEEVRLDPGSVIAEHSPDAGTQLVLRQARLSFGADEATGILLDAQLGRSVTPTSGLPATIGEAAAAADSAAARAAAAATGEGDDARPDSASLPATPAPRPGAEALLLDNSGYYAVFTTSAAGSIAWIHSGERSDVWRGARLEPLELEEFPEAGTDFPVSWRVAGPSPGFAGELSAEAADRAALDDGRTRALGYVLVSGWIEDRGARREVYGLVRHVR